MQHSHRQDVEVINRCNALLCTDYNRFNDFSKSGKKGEIQSGVLVFLTVLILISSATAVSAAQRYMVRRPVTPAVPDISQATALKAVSEEEPQNSQCTIHWETDYEAAVRSAKDSRCNLLIYFEALSDSPELAEPAKESYVQKGSRHVAEVQSNERVPLPIASACREFNQTVLKDWTVQSELGKYVLLKLPMDVKKRNTGDSPDFAEMARYPGFVLMEFENSDVPYFGQTVAILPFWRAVVPTVEETLTFLTLPAGTLTQRTMIYAVRIHPHNPLGADGTPDSVAASAATEQAEYQADKGVMGHQNYGTRSNRALDALGGGSPSEICAQSWSSESVFEAAIGCMRAWRNSSAHWNFVRRQHTHFGFDIRRGKGDAWYATGFFVD
ncbi:MAG: hypothetical protein LBT46_15165 [Planctomycetaceae bacterium]|jgi:hypothetical protein|nr:hypothetical protein [Planctomycetaceae bacterium]